MSLRVDEVFVHVPLAVRARFIAEIEGITYDMVHNILPPGRKPKCQQANSSTAPVYRVKLVEEAAFPGGTLALRKEEEGALGINTPQWTTHEEPLEGPDGREQIVERAVAGKSFCVLGAAGIGKSVALRAVKAALEESGQACQCIALTHTAARNLGKNAMTTHGFVMRNVLHGSFSGKVVLIERSPS